MKYRTPQTLIPALLLLANLLVVPFHLIDSWPAIVTNIVLTVLAALGLIFHLRLAYALALLVLVVGIVNCGRDLVIIERLQSQANANSDQVTQLLENHLQQYNFPGNTSYPAEKQQTQAAEQKIQTTAKHTQRTFIYERIRAIVGLIASILSLTLLLLPRTRALFSRFTKPTSGQGQVITPS